VVAPKKRSRWFAKAQRRELDAVIRESKNRAARIVRLSELLGFEYAGPGGVAIFGLQFAKRRRTGCHHSIEQPAKLT
jgi:hypothetical protein